MFGFLTQLDVVNAQYFQSEMKPDQKCDCERRTKDSEPQNHPRARMVDTKLAEKFHRKLKFDDFFSISNFSLQVFERDLNFKIENFVLFVQLKPTLDLSQIFNSFLV